MQNTMKFLLILFLNICFCSALKAQTNVHSNSWIDYDNEYIKIDIAEDGIYRISFEELKNAGLKSFKNIGIFHHGKPVAIETINETNGELRENGYIQFYAEKNKGELDSLVYGSNEKRNNPYQSLFSDISAYFLRNLQEKQDRISVLNLSQKTNKNTFTEELIFAPNSQYSFNNSIGLLPLVMQSYYETGEGWTGKYISSDSTANIVYTLKDIEPNSQITMELKLNGRSLTNHALNLEINKKATNQALEFEPFGIIEQSYIFNDIISDKVTLRFTPKLSQKFDWYSITFAKFKYTRKLEKNIINRAYSSENAVYLNPAWQTFDITDPKNAKKIISVSEGIFTLEKNKALIYTSTEYKKPLQLKLLSFKKLPENPSFLIITDPVLETSANAYATYRSSALGGKHITAIAYTDDIYNQFSYGEKSPMAIFNYLKYSVKDRKKTFLLLLGKATTFPDVLKSSPDMVPSFGYPASDLMLSSGPDYMKKIEWIPTGRISASKNIEVLNYLEKVKEHEANFVTEWRTKGLHLSGGQNQFELFVLKNILDNLSPSLVSQDVFHSLKTRNKPSDNLIEQVDISEEINKGIGFMSFVGHGSTAELDYNIGFCSDPKRNINNKGKYPLMFFNGCGVGNVFYRYNVLSSDWLLTPNKGAIAVLANSYWSFASSTQQYLSTLYSTMFENPLAQGKSIGESQIIALNEMQKNISDPYVRSGIHQVVLQGDPAVRIFPFEKPDFTIPEAGIFLQSSNGIKTIAASDSIVVGTFVHNYGLFSRKDKYAITAKVKWQNGQESNYKQTFDSKNRVDTCYFTIKNNGQIKTINLTIDSSNLIEEYSKSNNTQEFSITENWNNVINNSVYPESAILDRIPPVLNVKFDGRTIKNNAIVASNTSIEIKLEDERRLELAEFLLDIYLKTCSKCEFEPVFFPSYISRGDKIIIVELKNLNLKPGEYTLLIKSKDNANNSPGKVYEKQFVILESNDMSVVQIQPNPTIGDIQVQLNIKTTQNPVSGNLTLYDLTGKQLEYLDFEPKVGENKIILPRQKGYSPGTYLLKFEIIKADNSREIIQEKVVLI
jgi:Peptidase family C25